MNDLLYAKGLILIDNFISEKEELDIISNIPPTNRTQSKNTRNSIRRYGSNIPYKNQMESEIIPDYLDKLSDKIVDQSLLDNKPNSISINEYLAGNAIAPHIDSMESGSIVTIISLLSEAIMSFSANDQEFLVTIPSRSLIQLTNEIRYKWKHGILPVKSKRYSIVFRNG